MTPSLVAPEVPLPSTDADEARRVAEAVLARPEYRPPAPSPLSQVLDWVARQLDRLLPDGGAPAGAGGGGPATVLGWVVVIAGAAAVLWLLVRVWRSRVPGRVRVRDGAVEAGEAAPLDAASWRRRAEAEAAAGRWATAVRCRYRALVAALDACAVVDDRPGLTTGEHRAAVRTAAPGAAEAFERATRLVEAIAFGGRPASAGDDAEVRSLSEAVLAAAGTGPRPGGRAPDGGSGDPVTGAP